MSNLENVSIKLAPLSNRIVLARFGKDKSVALETKDAMSEFLQVLVQYAFDGKMPAQGEEAEVSFGGGDEQFTLTVARTPARKVELRRSIERSLDDFELIMDRIDAGQIDRARATARQGAKEAKDALASPPSQYPVMKKEVSTDE